MDKITKIEDQNNPERVNIYVNNKFFMGAYKDVIYNLKLRENKEIDEIELKSLIENETYAKAKNKALNILSYGCQSENNMRYKLIKQDFDDNTIDRVIIFLKEYNFLNDIQLAQSITKDKLNIKKFGKNKIKESLYKKGLDKSIIENTLKVEVCEDIEFENAIYLAKKKLDKIKHEDKSKVYRKLSQHLIYKGFDFNLTRKVINTLLNENFYLEE